jgi:hypothetical protein
MDREARREILLLALGALAVEAPVVAIAMMAIWGG